MAPHEVEVAGGDVQVSKGVTTATSKAALENEYSNKLFALGREWTRQMPFQLKLYAKRRRRLCLTPIRCGQEKLNPAVGSKLENTVTYA